MKELPSYFIQVHQAFVINPKFFKAVNFAENEVKMKYYKKLLPIGSSFRKDVEARLNVSE